MSGSSETLRDLSLARGTLNRAGPRRSEPDLLPLLLKDPHTKVLELVGDRAKVTGSDGGSATLMLRAPQEQDTLRLAVFLGRDDDGTAYVGVVGEVGDGEGSSDTGAVPGGSGSSKAGSSTSWSSELAPSSGTLVSWRTLREVGALLSDRDAGMFATMLGLANWHASHTHCPICGAMTTPAHAGWIRRCTQDGTEHFPRTDPAVIMAVTDASDRLLLARSPHWAPGRLSVLAGFVEPGESLEAAVAREVYEEVGVVVEQVRYLGNQPWPFPSSLMVGFSARALGPRLHLDQVEIVEAMWVTREELSEMVLAKRFGIAPTVSIARRMIEHWYGGPVG